MSNRIRAFIYFARHHQAPLSLSQATFLIPQLQGPFTCPGMTNNHETERKAFFLEALGLRKLNGDESK